MKAQLATGTYCTPSLCGLGCTREDYELAAKRSDDLCARLGSGWAPEVWENLGWHYGAINDGAAITMNAPHHGGKARYFAIMGGHQHSDRGLPCIVSGTYDNPQAAFREVIITAMERATAYNAAVLAAVSSVDVKSQPKIAGKVAKFIARGKRIAS